MQFPITEFPSYINEMCEDFAPVFHHKRRFHQFKRLITGFALPEKHTIANINGLFVEHTDQSNLNRFITHSNWNDFEINRKKMEMINSVEGDGVVILDDYIVEKTGKEIHGVDWHYDHTKGHSIFGHQIADCVFSGKGIYPLLSSVYIRKGSKWSNGEFKTKIELQIEHLGLLVMMGLLFSTVVMDTWYFTKKLVRYIESIGKDWVAQSKSNRLVKSNKKWVSLESFAWDVIGRVPFKTVYLGDHVYYMKVFTVNMKDVGIVRLLISQTTKGKFNFYVSNRLDWNELAIATRYSRRWDIEVWHREGKGNYGLKDCQLLSDEGVSKYLTLSTLAATLLEIASMLSPVYAMLVKRARTPALKHRWILAEVVKQFISYVSQIGDRGIQKVVEAILSPYKSTIRRYLPV